MKKVVSVLLLILSLYSTGCHRQRPHPNTVRPVTTKLISDSLPVIQFEKQVIDLGYMTEGEVAGAEFIFHNMGKKDLVIEKIETTCGCTTPEWSQKPVPPGGEGVVKILFNSSEQRGLQNKSIRILSNARNNEILLAVTANVVPSENE